MLGSFAVFDGVHRVTILINLLGAYYIEVNHLPWQSNHDVKTRIMPLLCGRISPGELWDFLFHFHIRTELFQPDTQSVFDAVMTVVESSPFATAECVSSELVHGCRA